MKKSWGCDERKYAPVLYGIFFWYLSKNRRIRPEIFACRTPMSYHEFAHECSSLNLIFGYPRIRNYCRTFS